MKTEKQSIKSFLRGFFAAIHHRRSAGFTLMELIVYTAILGIVGAVGVGILSQTTRIYSQDRARAEVAQNLRSASEVIQRTIQQARGIDMASGSTLRLLMSPGDEDPTIFTLDANAGAITRQRGGTSPHVITTGQVRVTDLSFSIVTTDLAPVDSINRWAWNGNGLGWVDFGPVDGHVRVPASSGGLFGFARAHSLGGSDGLIALNCVSADNCTNAYQVNVNDLGQFAGWAWNSLFGWISFCGNNTSGSTWDGSRWICPASPTYGVNVDRDSGSLAGWAWMANFGWISFCGNAAGGSTWDGSRWVCPVNPTYQVAVETRVGRPINAVQARMTLEYRTTNPLLAYRETYDFAIALAQPAALAVTGITPASGTVGAVVSGVQVTGSHFRSGAVVSLARAGHLDISGSGFTLSGGALVGGSFNLAGAARGVWDVWVRNPDGQIGALADGFTVN